MGKERGAGGMPGVALSTGVLCLVRKVPREAMHMRAEQVWGHKAPPLGGIWGGARPGKAAGPRRVPGWLEAVTAGKL